MTKTTNCGTCGDWFKGVVASDIDTFTKECNEVVDETGFKLVSMGTQLDSERSWYSAMFASRDVLKAVANSDE